MENFLKELWQRRAEEESSVKKTDRDVRIYFGIKSTIEKATEAREQLEDLLQRVEVAVLRYTKSMDTLSLKKLREDNVEAVATADYVRTLAHNTVIDELNLLSRQFQARGLDNTWRSDIGLDRGDVTRWSLAVGAELRSLALEGEKP